MSEGVKLKLWRLVKERCNNFLLPGSSRHKCLRFLIDGYHVGFIRSDMLTHLRDFRNVFCETKDKLTDENVVTLHPNLTTFQQRSDAIREVMLQLRMNNAISVLKGWRDEDYGIYCKGRTECLLRMERSACSILGVVKYGVHINGYTVGTSTLQRHVSALTSNEGDIKNGNSGEIMNSHSFSPQDRIHKDDIHMWIAKRSVTKPTWPGLLDNMAAGGLNVDLGIIECARKECQEEASVPIELLNRIVPVGTISYIFEDERGIFPQIEYCFDLQLPPNFVPVNSDGEVDSFQLVPLSEVIQLIGEENFKPNSGMVALDFLYRHSHLAPDEVPQYASLKEWMHIRMPFE